MRCLNPESPSPKQGEGVTDTILLHRSPTPSIDTPLAPCFHLAALVAARSREQMNSSASQSDILMHATAPEPDVLRDPQLRDLVPFVAGNRTFAVFAVPVEG